MTSPPPLRVLMVTGAYLPELSGGGLQCKAIVEALSAEVRFAVLTTSTDRSLPAADKVAGTPVYRIFVDLSRRWSKLRAARTMALTFISLARSTDVVHIHGFSQKAILLILLAKLCRKRVVLTLHTAGQDEPKHVPRLAALAYARVDLYLAVSAPLADSLLAYGVSPTRIVRVCNGLDMTRFRPAAAGEQERLRRALDLPVDGVVILFVGFFSVDKGPHVLFDAWRRIATGAGDGSSLVYVGATESRYYEVDATLAPGIRKTAQREGLTGRIVFAGETPTIEEYYRAADLFVFPTRREAFGMALVEAMASGLACIASRIPGVTDDIVDEGKTGLLVEPHDVGALSAALSRVLTDRPFADRLGHAAREAVAARFAIERTAHLTLDAYPAAVADTRRGQVPMMKRGSDILCVSSIDWDFIWQGHQEIMSTLASEGHRVLFIENTGVRPPALRDLPRVRQRLANWWRSTKGFRQVKDNLFLYSPLIVPLPYSRVARWVNRTLLLRSLRRWMAATGFNRPITWTFLPTPLARDLVMRVDSELTIYYCIDDLASSSPEAKRITSSEEQLFRDADLVFVTSEQLRQRAARFSDRVHLFPFGVSLEGFERVRESADRLPDDVAGIKRPIVGYVGGLHQWVDVDLLCEVARRMPDASLVLVGPEQADMSALRALTNVHLLGKKSHADVPRYVKAFDVGLVPYRLSDYTANVYPTKLNEYLAMGTPVVATYLAEIRRFNAEHGDVVSVAATPEVYVDAIRGALQPASAQLRDRRIAVARTNSWSSRIETMSALIDAAIARKGSVNRGWEDTLRRAYRATRKRAIEVVLLVAVIYLLLFQTPLLWWSAAPLKLSSPPAAADAIVVFAGGVGESGQAGGGYQERVKQAIDLYKAGYAKNVVLSSGYVYSFREAEVMRALAIDNGIPAPAIVLELQAKSTYDNVRFVKAILADHHWSTILLVSSPYNMRRAVLTWHREAPAVTVVPSPPPQSQFYEHTRGATLQQIRGVVWEYVATFAYWRRGWL